jgi:branched-chain amino acid transport system ATP-binding protein
MLSKPPVNLPLSSGVKKTNDREAVRKPILRVAEISHRFNGIVALSHVPLVVHESEILALIGANGAGKTTMINVVSGRFRLQAGSLQLLGSELSTLSADKRVKAGVSRTFQSVRMFAHLTVGENLRLGQMASGGRETPTIEELVKLLKLEGKQDSLPDSLTLAEQRKLEIGRAIASSPIVVFLDEPSVGMNELERAELASLIKDVRDRGTAVVLIDHNLDLALSLADRVVVLDFGELLAEGTPGEIINNPLVRQAYLGRTEVML